MKKSQLDKFATTLLEKRDEGVSLEDMQAWLKGEGLVVGRSTVGDFILQLEQRRSRERLLGQIVTGANQVREVEQQFAKNPAPELETLIKLHRVLILQLATDGNANPESVKLSDQLTNTVLQALSAQTKAHFKEREVTLAEQKAAEAKKTDQQKALEMCLEEAKEFPEVWELFNVAFSALKKAKAKK